MNSSGAIYSRKIITNAGPPLEPGGKVRCSNILPFDECGEWVRFERPLRMPKHGWDFANDPTQFPLYRGEGPETVNAW